MSARADYIVLRYTVDGDVHGTGWVPSGCRRHLNTLAPNYSVLPPPAAHSTAVRLPSSRSMSSSDAGSLPISSNLATISRAGLLLFDLLGEEPLELRDRRERLLLEGRLVEGVDLAADRLLLRQRAFEHVGERAERLTRLVELLQGPPAVASQDKSNSFIACMCSSWLWRRSHAPRRGSSDARTTPTSRGRSKRR